MGNHFESPEARSRSRMNTPKFDDTIYAVGRDIRSPPQGRGEAADKMGESLVICGVINEWHG